MKSFFKNYSLSIILALLFLASWLIQGFTQWMELAQEAEQHGQVLTRGEFLPAFLSATMENWQSEFLQLFSFVVLATYFIHKNSPQSRDGDDIMQKKLDRIEKILSEYKERERKNR